LGKLRCFVTDMLAELRRHIEGIDQ